MHWHHWLLRKHPAFTSTKDPALSICGTFFKFVGCRLQHLTNIGCKSQFQNKLIVMASKHSRASFQPSIPKIMLWVDKLCHLWKQKQRGSPFRDFRTFKTLEHNALSGLPMCEKSTFCSINFSSFLAFQRTLSGQNWFSGSKVMHFTKSFSFENPKQWKYSRTFRWRQHFQQACFNEILVFFDRKKKCQGCENQLNQLVKENRLTSLKRWNFCSRIPKLQFGRCLRGPPLWWMDNSSSTWWTGYLIQSQKCWLTW